MAASAHSSDDALHLTDEEFSDVQKLAYRIAGISMGPSKKALVLTRWSKRVRQLGLSRFRDYLQILSAPDQTAELQTAIDLLTTNETYFFREPAHFDFLRTRIVPHHPRGDPLRVWSAACSSGEEPYTIAMVLADCMGERPWEVLASDVCTKVVARAAAAQYADERAHSIPKPMLHKYCLKGVGPKAGTFTLDKPLRKRVQVRQINLIETLPAIGQFDVIFLRNVMIYFDAATKTQVVSRLLTALKPGGWFFISHCETLNGITAALTMMQPSVYRLPG